MSVPTALIRDWDALASSLGLTPKYDDAGNIVPIGQREGMKTKVYVVWVGRAIGLFNNWGLAHAMTNAFPACSYKKYADLAAARLGWAQGPTRLRGTWMPPRPRPAMPTPGIGALHYDESEGTAAPVLPQPPVHIRIPAAPPPEPAGDSGDSDDSDQYWESPPSSPSALAPTISSVSLSTPASPPSDSSTLGLYSMHLSPASLLSPSLTSGTISPRTIDTPLPSMADFVDELTPPTINQRLPASGSTHVHRARPQVLVSTPAPGFRARPARSEGAPARATPSVSVSIPTSPNRSRRPVADPIGVAAVGKPERYFVVIRGDFPGIYFDRNTALVMVGTSPGMKVVAFKSLKRATWYFVKQYMAGKVGVPVVLVASEDSDEEGAEPSITEGR